ncbi:hypothetical protein [Grimontia sp. NTOU-MAR1]|uniref:hypothetical protein n=1 Tax=Grimontia sp. NTOU-MAR1 TaxID=3111011 RepID=UPI002DBC7443|nr:hypothetical protein [Grimontia sp. NTOU-MAR1]WRV97963.1 hypothetical protein VP504_00545 [Grimontia sp. NTOU-MAR1]
MKLKSYKLLGALLACSMSFPAYAAMTSDWVNVTQIRPIVDGNVYFDVDRVAICNSNAFLIKVKDDGSKAVYSTLLSAALAGKSVKLETWGSCAVGGGWGTEIQAIYLKIQ